MKKITTAALFLMLTGTAFAQEGRVGINTTDPKTTFDVNGKIDGSGNLLTTDITGMQAPRLTRAELTAKGDVLYGADQKGALVYITDVTAGNALTQRINITAAGYYYFDGAVWQKMASASEADITNDAWVNDATNTMVKLGTLSDGTTARPAGTEFVALDNGNVGIGTNAPNSKLHVVGNTEIHGNQVQYDHGATPFSSFLSFKKDRMGGVVNSGDELGQVIAGGFVGSSYKYSARMIFRSGPGTISNTSSPGSIVFGTVPDGSTTMVDNMYITPSGNIGMGITPTNKLHVKATTNPLRLEGLQTAAATDNIMTVDATGVVTKTATALSALDATNDAWVNDATNTMVKLGTTSTGAARPAGTEFVSKDNGNVGIGTNAPAYKLDVIGGNLRVGTSLTNATVKGANILYPHYTNSEENIRMISGYTSSTESVVVVGGGDPAFNSVTKISFFTAANNKTVNGVERMRISSNGNVGIGTGTTSPTSKLQVVGLPIHVDNTAALAAGLTVGAFYHAGDGIVRVVF